MSPPGQGAGRDDILREVLKLQGLIRAVLRRYGVPAADLPDLEHDVLVVALRRIDEGGFRPLDPTLPLAENVAAWVGGIARWTAIENARIRARAGRVFSRESQQHPIDRGALQVPSAEAQLLAREALEIIGRMKMSPTQRECVRLTALGFTAREIGERLKIPEETAASCVKRARAAYKRAMARQRHR